MDSILITPKSEQEYSFVMEMLKRMKIKAKPMHMELSEQIPGLPCTQEELIKAVERSKEDIKAGRVTTHKELKKQRLTWK